MSTIAELLERVERAAGPDRTLDADIFRMHTGRVNGVVGYAEVPEYTATVEAALALVSLLNPRLRMYAFGNADLDPKYMVIKQLTKWRCGLAPLGFSLDGDPRRILEWPMMYASTPPLAILAALLRAQDHRSREE